MEKPLLLLAASGVHSDQLQPLLLDVLPAGDVVKVFVLKIQGVWRGEWRGGAGEGLEATSDVPVSLGELTHFVGLMGSRESSWAFPPQHHPRVTLGPGDATTVAHLQRCWGFP